MPVVAAVTSMRAVAAPHVTWNVVATVSRFGPPVVIDTVRGLLPPTGQFPAAPANVT